LKWGSSWANAAADELLALETLAAAWSKHCLITPTGSRRALESPGLALFLHVEPRSGGVDWRLFTRSTCLTGACSFALPAGSCAGAAVSKPPSPKPSLAMPAPGNRARATAGPSRKHDTGRVPSHPKPGGGSRRAGTPPRVRQRRLRLLAAQEAAKQRLLKQKEPSWLAELAAAATAQRANAAKAAAARDGVRGWLDLRKRAAGSAVRDRTAALQDLKRSVVQASAVRKPKKDRKPEKRKPSEKHKKYDKSEKRKASVRRLIRKRGKKELRRRKAECERRRRAAAAAAKRS